LEQRFLDLMDRIGQTHMEEKNSLAARMEDLERSNKQLTARLLEIESALTREATALSNLNATLDAFLAPPDSSWVSDISSSD